MKHQPVWPTLPIRDQLLCILCYSVKYPSGIVLFIANTAWRSKEKLLVYMNKPQQTFQTLHQPKKAQNDLKKIEKIRKPKSYKMKVISPFE